MQSAGAPRVERRTPACRNNAPPKAGLSMIAEDDVAVGVHGGFGHVLGTDFVPGIDKPAAGGPESAEVFVVVEVEMAVEFGGFGDAGADEVGDVVAAAVEGEV